MIRSVLHWAVALSVCVCAVARAADVPTMKIASVAPEGTPWASGLTELKKLVDEKAPGALKIKPFLGGTLGDENETVQAVQRGQLQAVGASTAALASVVPELAMLELPYLFRNAAEADFVLDGVALPVLEKAFADRGLVLLMWSENGYRAFGTRFGRVTSPAALAGHKMRSQESPVHLDWYRTLGASPVAIPVTEVLTSLQTGVIDGYDNTPLYAFAAQWTSATQHYTLTNHIYQPAAIVANRKFFDALPENVRQVLLSSRQSLMGKMRKEIRALNPILLQNLTDVGIDVYTPSTAELAAFEAPAQKARAQWLAKAKPADKALYDQIQKALAARRGGK